MPVSVDYVPEKETVVIVSTGAVAVDEIGCQSLRTVELLHQHGASRLLVDYSDARISVSTMDVYAIPDRYDALGLSRSVRIAVVLPRELKDTALFDFYADVTHNRGFMTRLFRSPDDAQRWLDSTG